MTSEEKQNNSQKEKHQKWNMWPHHVFYGQLEGGDLSDDLVVSLHLVHTLC